MNREYELDINWTDGMLQRYCVANNIAYTDEQNKLFDCVVFDNVKFRNKDGKFAVFSDVKIGDEIYVNYVPDSQKYLSYYEKLKIGGKVFYKDTESDNMLLYFFDDNILHIKSLERVHCSYYGSSRGYTHCIYKIEY